MNEQAKFKLVGTVKFEYADGTVVELKNAIQPDAAQVLARNLSNTPGYEIAQIAVYNGATLLKANPVTLTVSGVGNNVVNAVATFSATDFTGAYTEVRLLCNSSLTFSKLTGLTLNKGAVSLQITWSLTITTV